MNYLYLIKDEKKNHALFKIGFTKNLEKRIYQYSTHNPETECISVLLTMEKTNRKLEKAFHDEVLKKGYSFIKSPIDGKKTEWIKVDYSDPFFSELEEKGLNAFKSGRNRKNLGAYVLNK